MSPKLFPDPVLLLASNSIGKLGTLDADNLSCIWTVFTKCGENLENGRRLENLSWRLWYRTTHFCNTDSPFFTDRTPNNPTSASSEFLKDKNLDIPELSASVDSASSLDEHEIKGKSPNYHHSSKMHVLVQEPSIKPKTVRYVSPGRFQKIITDLTPFKIITERWKSVHHEPLSTSHQHESCLYTSSKDTKQPVSIENPWSACSDSNSVPSSNIYTSHIFNTEQSSSNQQPPLPVTSYTNDISSSCINNTSHSETHTVQPSAIKIPKHTGKIDKMFFIQETLPSESFIEDASKPESRSNVFKSSRQAVKLKSAKHISFQKPTNTSIFETSDNDHSEYNDTNNSADDDDDWDSIYDSSYSSINGKSSFQKLQTCSPPPLHSRRSLLSFMLQNKTNGGLSNIGSKSSPAIALSQTSVSSTTPKQISHQQIATNQASNLCPVISPRTIRRNMFATELSESLRKNLLWERQQRTVTTLGTLKRRHTAYDITKLNEFPSQPCKENPNFFDDKNYCYHAAGW